MAKHTFPALTSQFAVACNLTALYLIMTLREGSVGRMFPLSLLAYAPLLYLLNRLYLRRERTLRGVILLNLAVAACFLSVCILVDGRPEVAALAFMLILVAWLTIKGQSLALKPPQMSGMLLTLDGSILTLVLFVAYASALELDLAWSFPAVCGVVAILLGVAVRRMDRALGLREAGVLAVAFLVVLGAMALLLTLVAAPTGQGIVLAFRGLGMIIDLIQRILTWLIQCLMALFKSESPPAVFPQEEFVFEMETMPEGEENPILAAVLGVILAAAALMAVIWLLRYLGGIKLGVRKAEAVSSVSRSRPSLIKALRDLLRTWQKKLRLRRFLHRTRNTPIGMYFHLVHRCRMSPWHKRPGETPHEFLDRLTNLTRTDEALTRAMEQLIPAVDAGLYGGRTASTLEGASLIRRRIGAVVRRQAARERLERIRAGWKRSGSAERNKSHEHT